ncbi:GNAT family N-acetyltransferase [uncultured Tateyamaria sp.]|nr:GNAT family N-acetyltransferase [uncultured Tateyamaria sp.]
MIREYTENDTDALITIWEKANALAHPFLAAEFVAFVKDAMRSTYLPNAETWVLEVDGQPIGFIAMIGNEIGGLFLDPECHGRGQGRAMVDHIMNLKGPLQVEVFKDNKVGRPFYERYGFEYVEEYLHEQSGAISVKMSMPGAVTA